MKVPAHYPRAELAHRPTPLQPMHNLTALLDGPPLWIKRDDCTGLGLGGNKARQLEFYLGDAVAAGADTILITGAVQSNYAAAAAAAAAKLGMECDIQLEERVPGVGATYRRSGNVLLNQLFGARLHSYPDGEDEEGADASLEAIAAGLRSEGKRPYVIHLSEGHRPLGTLGYVEAAGEILEQAAARDLSFQAVVVASGSGATHAGLLVGLRAEGCRIPVHGICVRRDAGAQRSRIVRAVRAVEDELESGAVVAEEDVVTHDDWLTPGYGRVSDETLAAIRLASSKEGLLLDPVYTGKSFAGLIGLARRGEFAKDAPVLYVHTGGVPALFAYRDVLTRDLEGSS